MDLASARLPSDAFVPTFTMRRHAGRDQIAATVATFGWEGFEPPLPTIFFRLARVRPGLVVDVGANTGFYSILAACASPRNRVVAFEPMAEILEYLRLNLEDNGALDRVRLIRAAVGRRNGKATFFIPSQEHRLIETSASLSASFKETHSRTEQVLVRTLDRVLFRPSLMKSRVTIVKVDVEGHETEVLEGAAWTIRIHRPVVFVEILERANADALNRFLARHRYVDLPLYPGRILETSQKVTFHPQAWNHALVPAERVGLVKELTT